MHFEANTELFLYLNKDLGIFADQLFLFISSKWTAIPLYLLMAWLMIRKYGKRSASVFIAAALLILVSDQVSVAFKNFVEQPRPCHEPALANVIHTVNGKCGGLFGFYSSHASNTMAISVFCIVLLRIPMLSSFLIAWCFVVGYSRIYLGVHYPFDIFCGWIAGLLFGLTAGLLLLKRPGFIRSEAVIHE